MEASVLRQQLNAIVPFNRTAGVEVTEIAAGRGVAHLSESPARLNHVGTIHAGALFTLADAASGAAVVGLFADEVGGLSMVVRKAETEFLKPARGTITATAQAGEEPAALSARLAADGRADSTVHVSLHDDAGLEVARVRITWHFRRAIAPTGAA